MPASVHKRRGVNSQGETERGNSLQLAFQQLRHMIVSGRLAPGSWMIEAELAARLGFSRTPIRGALHWLEREGYVNAAGSGSKSRMLVSPLTQDDAQELYSIIAHLEGLGARLAAQLPAEKREALVGTLRKFNDGLLELARTRHSDANRIFELDLNFHRTIMEAGAGPRLLDFHNTVQPQAERYWRLYAGAIVDELDQSIKEHAEIMDGVLKGDPDRAELCIQANWEHGVKRLSRLIADLGERGSW
jgi:DNA-binding GntR family transcriptional regulator